MNAKRLFSKTGFLWRFRVRSLLLLVTVSAIWLAVWYTRQPLSTVNVDRLRVRQKIEAKIWKVAWSNDGKRVTLVGWEKPVQIHDGVTLWKIRSVGDSKKIIHFAFSPDPRVVTWCENGGIPVIEFLDSEVARTLEAVPGQWKMAFSPDGKTLAGGCSPGGAKLWDVATGRLLHSLNVGPIGGGLTPVFSPDGQILAVGNRNSDTPLFDPKTGEVVLRLPKTMSQELKFHPTEPLLAVGYVDASVVLWDTRDGRKRNMAQTRAEEIYTLDWSPDGQMLVTAGLRGDIDLLDGKDLTLMHRLPAPEWVISVRFRPDAKGLIVAGGDQAGNGTRSVEEWIVPSRLQKWAMGE